MEDTNTEKIECFCKKNIKNKHDNSSIECAVQNCVTFTITSHNFDKRNKNKKTKTSDNTKHAMLGSITFVVDEKGNNVFIDWLCVSNKCNENEIPVNEELTQNWRGCGLGVLLVIVIIKHCAAKNSKGPTLHLQCGMQMRLDWSFT